MHVYPLSGTPIYLATDSPIFFHFQFLVKVTRRPQDLFLGKIHSRHSREEFLQLICTPNTPLTQAFITFEQ